jgi:microcystin degradation protein MlrC
MPIIGTLDPHANLSSLMIEATDALIAYRSNPHLDQRARGRDAALLMARTLRGEVRPTQVAQFPPLAINIECQESTVAPCLPFYQLANAMLTKLGVLSNSILLGFPYADVREMGSSVICVTDGNAEEAGRLSRELANYLWTHREAFDRPLMGVEEALDQAAGLPGPICLLDMGDNVGGGSPADGTWLAHAIRDRRMRSAFVCLYDPIAVRQVQDLGVGSRIRLQVGGKTDKRHGEPFVDEFAVVSLHEGKFEEPEPRHGGFTHCDQGPTAIVRTDDGLTVMLTSRRMPPFSLRQLTSCDLDPASFHILVAKGVNAPVAAYAPVCRHLIRVNTPGVTTADMKSLDYVYRRRPMFPFEADTTWPVA